MRRFVSLLTGFLLAGLLGVQAFAFSLPNSWEEDGNTMIGVFKVKDDEQGVLSFWKAWQASARNLCVMSTDNTFYFIIVPEGDTVTFLSNNASSLYMRFTVGPNTEECMEFSYVDGAYHVKSSRGFLGGQLYTIKGIVSGTYLEINPPTGIQGTATYFPEFSGKQLGIVDDLGEGDPGSGGILDWLSDFWETFKRFLISLIVPPDEYYSDWFKTIHEAASDKLGPISDMLNTIKAAFTSLKDYDTQTPLYLDIEANGLYPGSAAIHADILAAVAPFLGTVRGWLTAICVLFTVIACYKRIVVLFEQ